MKFVYRERKTRKQILTTLFSVLKLRFKYFTLNPLYMTLSGSEISIQFDTSARATVTTATGRIRLLFFSCGVYQFYTCPDHGTSISTMVQIVCS